jgi:two-component system, NarL family, response regulator YdfI
MEANGKIEIIIVGDSLIFRNGLRMLIDGERGFKVTGEAATIPEAVVLLTNNKPNVILIDSSEVLNGDAKGFLSEQCKNISTLILTNDDALKTHQKYLLLGANGVVTKEQNSATLFKAIKQVDSEEFWFRRDVLTLTIEQLVNEKESSLNGFFGDKCAALTERETEVLNSVCQGMKNKEIAESLFITETTVRHHLTSIFEKLSVKSRLELAIYAFNEGLVAVPPIEKVMVNQLSL